MLFGFPLNHRPNREGLISAQVINANERLTRVVINEHPFETILRMGEANGEGPVVGQAGVR